MRKYRLVIEIDDDTYPIEDLCDLIETEGLTIRAMSEVSHDRI